MTQPSRLYRLIEERIDGTLVDYVAARRPATSWRDLADEISKLTGIEISNEGLRLWFGDRIEVRYETVIRDAPAEPADAA